MTIISLCSQKGGVGKSALAHPRRGKVKDWPAYLRAFCIKHRLTQVQLADLLPTGTKAGRRTVEDWERGERKLPEFLKRDLRDLARELATSEAPG
jgi:hypothetical protein